MKTMLWNAARHSGKTAIMDAAIETWLKAGHKVAVVHVWGLELRRRKRHLTLIQTYPHNHILQQVRVVSADEATSL